MTRHTITAAPVEPLSNIEIVRRLNEHGFRDKLRQLINAHGVDNMLNNSDNELADYLVGILASRGRINKFYMDQI